ncbi:pentatricopeptide repeat-containing protein-like [Dorcoceras hygrometricum]|uniref:Pentatricopeptide repeat-containing protein-like n=1 Tax=Dorcoceras hygrometricum TaxID=472368 RepID=A0A2Z7BUB1_9LAMI|nr:pentatricopeptide repeat-containing protein-like [Dorcoceras hygrometricum]
MATSFFSNSVHVDFESALAMGEPGSPSRFLREWDSEKWFVVSTVNGVAIEISEKLFAETFDLPVDGLADISEMPKDKIFDARSIVSLTGEPVTLSGLKSQMKMHYHLLCDIMEKSISMKAGSFNAITVEKFSLLTAVVCDVKLNPGTKQDKGFAIQISLLLESVPNLELGASSEFPSSKILTDKTIHQYIIVIDKSVVKRKRTSKKKSTLKLVSVAQEAIPIQIVPVESAVEHMVEDQQAETEDAADRPAAEEETHTPGTKQAKGFAIQISLLLESVPNLELGASSEFPSSKILTDKTIHQYIIVIDKSVVKRKRTSKKKSTLKLVSVAQEAIPIQIVPVESAVEHMVEDQQAETEDAADRPAAEEETHADRPVEEILDFSTKGQDVAKGDRVETWFDRSIAEEIATAGDDSPTEKVNDEVPWFVRPFLSSDHDNERLFETGSDSADTMEFEVHSQNLPVVRDPNVDPAAEQEIPDFEEQLVDSVNEEEMQDENVQSAEAQIDKDEAMSLEDLILSIPADIPVPSASIEITKIKMGTKIQIPGVDEKLCYLASLPKITDDDKGKALLVEKDPVKGHPAREHYFSICANIDLLVKSLSVVEPGYRVAPRQYSVFAFRVSQFCSVFVDFSVFSWLPTTDITDFLSSIALYRTVLRNVQRSVSVVHPTVQFLDQHISSPTSSEDSSMNFDNTDIDATATDPAFSLPGSSTVSLDITRALNQLQASLDQISHRDDGAAFKDTILMHLRDIEKKFTARFDAQDRWIGALRNDLNDQRNLLSLEFKSSHRQLHTQIAAASIHQTGSILKQIIWPS